MVHLSLNEAGEWVAVGLGGWFLAVRLMDQGVKLIDRTFKLVWRGLEKATQGRMSKGKVSLLAQHIVHKAKSGAGFAVMTVADPFIVIGKSFMPHFEMGEAPVEAPAEVPVENSPPVPPAKTRPSEQEYKAAMGRFGLSPSCPEVTAAKTWAKLRDKGDRASVDADWSLITDYRGFRKD